MENNKLFRGEAVILKSQLEELIKNNVSELNDSGVYLTNIESNRDEVVIRFITDTKVKDITHELSYDINIPRVRLQLQDNHNSNNTEIKYTNLLTIDVEEILRNKNQNLGELDMKIIDVRRDDNNSNNILCEFTTK